MSVNPFYRPARLSAVNDRCRELWQDLVQHENEYRIRSHRLDCGAVLMDMGVSETGSLEAGRILTELCQGGLAKARIGMTQVAGVPLPEIFNETLHPAAGCMDMQMGLPFPNALLSGPIRLFIEPLRFVEADIPLSEAKDAVVALIEPYPGAPEFSDKEARLLSEMSGVAPEHIRIILAPGNSLPGSTQVSGRAVEDVVLTIQRSLLIDSSKVIDICGRAPICPYYEDKPGVKRLDADDFLHYIAEVYLTYYSEEGEDVAALCRNLTFESLDIFGSYWADMLEAAGGDFFKIPNITDVNRVGRVVINDRRTGRVYAAGRLREDLIEARLTAAP